MNLYITIDGGTTNTRINLVKNKRIIDNINLNIGARANIDEGNLLRYEIKKAIEKLLESNKLPETDIICILASGMITSEFGLCNLEHIETPAGLNELHTSMEKRELKDISGIPFVFIRGVKTNTQSFNNADIMRGEETELMGIVSSEYGKSVYVLPGSHSKHIKTDEKGRIIDFSTMMTGEMIASLSENTILKDAVSLKNCEINNEYLLEGYDYCSDEGINKALFKVRMLKNIFKCTKDETYSFFIGTVLCDEIKQIMKYDIKNVVLGGNAQIKKAMAQLLKFRTEKKVIVLEDIIVNLSTAIGAIRIFENK